MSVDFDINDALKHYMSDPAAIHTPEADAILVDCENDPEGLGDNGTINAVLNPIVDAVAENPDAITRSAHFDSLQFLLKCASISAVPLPAYFPLVPLKARRGDRRCHLGSQSPGASFGCGEQVAIPIGQARKSNSSPFQVYIVPHVTCSEQDL
jgi:hypothetical protein